jgi:hypothetical protein
MKVEHVVAAPDGEWSPSCGPQVEAGAVVAVIRPADGDPAGP